MTEVLLSVWWKIKKSVVMMDELVADSTEDFFLVAPIIVEFSERLDRSIAGWNIPRGGFGSEIGAIWFNYRIILS